MLRIVPTTDKKSLGTRFMPEFLKQMKTAIQNVLTHMLKKKRKNLKDFKFVMPSETNMLKFHKRGPKETEKGR